MRGIFPETKRSWSDGLNLFDDTRDYHEVRFGLFGGSDDSGGGGGLEDEDIDGDLQQSIAAAASGLSRDQFDYSPGFDPGDSDTATAIGATRDIIDASARGNEAAIEMQRLVGASPPVQQAIANLTSVPVGSATPVQDIFTADTGMVTDMSPVEQQQIAAQQQLDAARNQAATFAPSPVGIQTLSPPGGTLGDSPVYSAVLNNPMRQDERTMNPADFETQYGFAPRGIAGINAAPQVNAQVVLGGGSDDMGSGVPLGGSYDRFAAANPRQGYTPNVVSSPALRGEKAAAGTPAENFYTDAYRELYPDVEGNIPGTFMAGVGNTVRNLPGIGMLLGGGPQDLPSASEQAAFKSGELLSMGGTMDPQTGAISDIPAGRGTLDMNRFGMVTYSGMPDPNYTGPYRELVNPPPQDLSGSEEEVIDPCPPGFVLKDGVCTPVEEAGDDAGGPGGDFVFQPPIAPPTFQPITQATPINQINPFVLQPYTPVQAQNIGSSRVAQGIQPMSPTGAALGRQI